MPELPEVETVCRGLAPTMEGANLTRLELRRKTLRYPLPRGFATRHTGQRILTVRRRAKYILIDFDHNQTILIHLGMSGSMGVESSAKKEKEHKGLLYHPRSRIVAHDHVVFHLKCADGHKALVIYNDPRRFGFMGQTKTCDLADHPFLKNLGIEPLGDELTAEFLAQKFYAKKTCVKSALLDQRIIAGLGNIYVCEALWRTGLSPLRQAMSLTSKKTLKELCKHIVDILKEAIEAGGSSLRDHKDVDGKPGYFQHRFCVYDRTSQPCVQKKCKGTIQRIVQSGRSSYFCSQCQK